MKVGTIGKVLIALGVALMLYALNMPVSLPGAPIVNIHLMEERRMAITLGGMLFLGGIVLYAVFKLKLSKDDEKLIEAESRRKREQLAEMQKGAVQKADAASRATQSYVAGYLNAEKDMTAARWRAGIFVSICLFLPGVFVLEWLVLLVIAAVFGLAFMPGPGSIAIKRLYLLNSIAFVIMALFTLLDFTSSAPLGTRLIQAAIPLVFAIVSWVLRSRVKQVDAAVKPNSN